MKLSQILFLPLIISNPLGTYTRNLSDQYYIQDSSIEAPYIEGSIICDRSLRRVAFVHLNRPKRDDFLGDQGEIEESNDTQLASDLRDKLFPSAGSTFSETTASRTGNTSRRKSTLVFRSERKVVGGKEKPPRGASDPLSPTNLDNFERANIPIDPMRDSRKAPNSDPGWYWCKTDRRWKMKPSSRKSTKAEPKSSKSGSSSGSTSSKLVKSETVRFK